MQAVKKVLVTGGSGMIGSHLTPLLLEKGYEVSHLGRSKRTSGVVKNFVWDPEKNTLDPEALKDIDAVVHLAGVSVADKRWNARHKREVISSRTDTARMLVERLRSLPGHRVTTLVSASGISYYGLDDPARDAFIESDPPADDFMARVTVAWEREVQTAGTLGIRTVMLRTGVVLSSKGGALEKLALPVRFFVGAPLGTGRQYVNWIHIDDLCNLYIKAIEDSSMTGAYNAVAPDPVTNIQMTKAIARSLKRPLWLPPVPGFVVKLIAGGVAEIVLRGGKISSGRIQDAGFRFKFPILKAALDDLHRPLP